ncbi:hypothetical protein [Saccharopolyspora spinosa]|uniref:hypothetical protein n=1 Tax=Saccharopolyspora spinosa TaxID=60894 RepID=UPI0011D213CB|nr:hypothetical protein [Saccharopolyspora spinosa]
MWTLLAIPRASGALLSAVLQVVNGPVLATNSDVYKTPDGRLLAGDYERQSDGRVRFRPSRDGWIEFIKNEDDPNQPEPSRVTFKFDLGEALMDSRTRLFPDEPAEVYPYWPTRALPVPVGLPVGRMRRRVVVGGASSGAPGQDCVRVARRDRWVELRDDKTVFGAPDDHRVVFTADK